MLRGSIRLAFIKIGAVGGESPVPSEAVKNNLKDGRMDN